MNLFQVEFDFLDRKVKGPKGAATWHAAKAVEDASNALHRVRPDVVIQHLEAYVYGDGSIFRYYRTTLTSQELKTALQEALQGKRIWVSKVHVEDPNSNPFKVGVRTLIEYFSKHYSEAPA